MGSLCTSSLYRKKDKRVKVKKANVKTFGQFEFGWAIRAGRQVDFVACPAF